MGSAVAKPLTKGERVIYYPKDPYALRWKGREGVVTIDYHPRTKLCGIKIISPSGKPCYFYAEQEEIERIEERAT